MLPKVNFNKIQTRYNNEECFSAEHSTSSSRNRDSNEDPQVAALNIKIERTNNNKIISDCKNNNPLEIKTQGQKRNTKGGIKLKQEEINHNLFNTDTSLSHNKSINKHSQKESPFLHSTHNHILQHTELIEDKVVKIIPNNKCCHLTTAKEIRNLYPTNDTDIYSSVFSYLTSTPKTSVDEDISQHSKCKLQIKKFKRLTHHNNYKDNILPTGNKLNVTHLPSDNDEKFLKVLVKESKQTTTFKDIIVSIQKFNNDDVGLTTSVLISKDFINMKISPIHDHICPNRNNDRKICSETMEFMSSLQPQDLYNVLDQIQ